MNEQMNGINLHTSHFLSTAFAVVQYRCSMLQQEPEAFSLLPSKKKDP